MPTLYCPECGYNLTGLTEHRCPECGKVFDPVLLKEQAESELRYGVTTFTLFFTPILSMCCQIAFALTIVLIDQRFPYNPVTADPLDWIILLVLSAAAPFYFGIRLGKRYRERRRRNHPDRGVLPIWAYMVLHSAIQYTLMWFYLALLVSLFLFILH